VATGLKLHGVIYTVPAAAIALARVETLRRRFILAIVGSACAGATAILPYFEKDVSIAGHLRFLRVALNSGWNPSILIGNLLFSFILLAPIIVIWIRRKAALSLPDRWLLMALGFSVAIVSVIGSKLGGGSYYLLPLIPICIYGVAVIFTTSKPDAKNIAALIFVSLLLAYGPNLLLNLRPLYFDQVAASSEREKIAELKHYLHSYPDAQIGVSDDEHYSSYFYRVLSVWNGRPQHVDFSLWMDLAHAGVAEEHIVRFIKGCAVPTWILPLGAPFRQTNLYNRLPMLSESFRQTFSTNYRLIETGKAYQVWQCNANPRIE
jgi:hypothetical protein